MHITPTAEVPADSLVRGSSPPPAQDLQPCLLNAPLRIRMDDRCRLRMLAFLRGQGMSVYCACLVCPGKAERLSPLREGGELYRYRYLLPLIQSQVEALQIMVTGLKADSFTQDEVHDLDKGWREILGKATNREVKEPGYPPCP